MTDNENQNLQKTDTISETSVYNNIRETLSLARVNTIKAINVEMVNAYWEIGRQINEAIGERAEYGKHLLEYLSIRPTEDFGKGFTIANLNNMRMFASVYPICYTLCSKLTWSHYRLIMRIEKKEKREYYEKECAECGWSVRQLERQINSFYFERLLATQESGKDKVKNEISIAISN